MDIYLKLGRNISEGFTVTSYFGKDPEEICQAVCRSRDLNGEREQVCKAACCT
jgi:hypothetical protein